MAFSITQFQSNLTNSLQALDNNFATVSAQGPIACSVSGTNTLILTQNAPGFVPTVAITAYAPGMFFSGIAAANNTGPVTANVGSLGALSVYKDTALGAVTLTGGEFVAGCAFSLWYDSALNSGAGGFHLLSSTQNVKSPIEPSSVQINGGSTITNLQSGSVSVSFASIAGGATADQTFSVTGTAPLLPLPGDFVIVVPPSLPTLGLSWCGMVTSAGSLTSVSSAATIAIRMANCENVAAVPPAGVYRWRAERLLP